MKISKDKSVSPCFYHGSEDAYIKTDSGNIFFCRYCKEAQDCGLFLRDDSGILLAKICSNCLLKAFDFILNDK